MALRVEKTGRRSEYILKADRESSQPTKFILRPLTWEEEAEASEITAAMPMSADQALQINSITAKAKDEGRDIENLSAEELARICEIAPPDARSVNSFTKQHAVRVRYGILDILNLIDLNDQEVKMSGAEFARQAPAEVIFELGLEIQRLSRLPEGAIKK